MKTQLENSFFILIKNYKKILLVAVIFGLIGYGISFFLKPTYKTEIEFYAYLFNNEHYKGVFKSIQDYIYYDKKNELSHFLNLSQETTNDIDKIDFFALASEKNDYFRIELSTHSNQYINEIIEGIMYFINENKSNKTKLELEKNRLEKIIDGKENSINKIDSLVITKINSAPFLTEPYSSQNKLYDEHETLQMQLSMLRNVYLVANPVIPDKPYFPNKILIGLITFILGSLLSSVYFLYKSIINK